MLPIYVSSPRKFSRYWMISSNSRRICFTSKYFLPSFSRIRFEIARKRFFMQLEYFIFDIFILYFLFLELFFQSLSFCKITEFNSFFNFWHFVNHTLFQLIFFLFYIIVHFLSIIIFTLLIISFYKRFTSIFKNTFSNCHFIFLSWWIHLINIFPEKQLVLSIFVLYFLNFS